MTSFRRHLGGWMGGTVALTALILIATAAPALAAAPHVSSFTPTSGPAGAGCWVTITGSFPAAPPVTGVDFNGTVAPGFVVVSTSQINVPVPAGATTGPIHVINADGPGTSASNFTVASPGGCTPTITSFLPTSGPVGTGVTINGTNLLGATAVDFNGTAAAFAVVSSSSSSASQVSAFVPAGATTGLVHVVTPVATATSASNFTVGTGPAPTISSFTPTTGAVGTSVTITGTNFTGATSVTFNGVAATAFTVNSATQVTATVPTAATTGPIRVITPSGTGTSATNFTVTVAPLPTITSFTPTFGPTGKVVTITGTNFSGTGFTTTSVKFNNVTATFTVNSATQITATVPSTATTGKITVTTPGGTATSTANFVVSVLHSRTVSLDLRKHLIAKGEVSAGGFSACLASVEVKIQRMKSGHWKTVGSDTTGSDGSFKTRLDDKTGKYRARAPKVVLSSGADICSRATSPSQNHNH